ncbi:hypothetical protein PG995_011258 [Apiospora arundinis]|uniref:Uncharacterized protein n=1 Tax=Apiospora arundinis TaxID=335852 RepID=A0ABR2IUT7_9PEZI
MPFLPNKKKTPERDPVPARKVCAVTDCDEAATRIFNSSHKGFAARVCPYHQRFVATLPFVELCQYKPSLVDEEMQLGDELKFFVFPFSTGSESAGLPPDNAEDPQPCVNRATQIVLVGEHPRNCTLYLFCHGHCVRASHEYSGPIEDKHYMTKASFMNGNESADDRPTIPEKLQYLNELDFLTLQEEAKKAMNAIPTADDAIPRSFRADESSILLAVTASPVKEATSYSSPSNGHPADSQSVNDQSSGGESSSSHDCSSDYQYNSAKSTNSSYSKGDEFKPAVESLVVVCDSDNEADAKLREVQSGFEKTRILELKMAIRSLRAPLEAPQDYKDLDKMTEAELGMEFTRLCLSQPGLVSSNYGGVLAGHGTELEDHVYDSGPVSRKSSNQNEQDIRRYIHIWNWIDSWCDWRLFRLLVLWPLEKILGVAWALLLWFSSSRNAGEKREQPQSATPVKGTANSKKQSRPTNPARVIKIVDDSKKQPQSKTPVKVTADSKKQLRPTKPVKVIDDSENQSRPRTPAKGKNKTKECMTDQTFKKNSPKDSVRKKSRSAVGRAHRIRRKLAQLRRLEARRIKHAKHLSMDTEPKNDLLLMDVNQVAEDSKRELNGPGIIKTRAEKYGLTDPHQLPVVNGDLWKASSKPGPQMDWLDSLKHASQPPAVEVEEDSKEDDIKTGAQEDSSQNSSQMKEELEE